MKLKLILFILALQVSVGSMGRAENQSAEASDEVTNSGTSVYYSGLASGYYVTVGKKRIFLPELPTLSPSDVPPGIDLNRVQEDFMMEYRNLTPEEKQRFLVNREKFLTVATDVFYNLRFLFKTVGWGVDGVLWTGRVAKGSWDKTKSLSKRTWLKTKGLFTSNTPTPPEAHAAVENAASASPTTPEESEPIDLIEKSLLGLNKILVQKAKLVADSIEFGVTIGSGVSMNLGYKTANNNVAVGGLTDVLIHIGFKPKSKTYVLTIQSLNEIAKNTYTKVSVLAGLDLKVGCYFKDGQDHSLIKGGSYYPGNNVVGVSTYGDRVIAWGYASEINPFLPNDLFGYDTQGVAINLIHVEGSKLYPLFFKAENRSLLGQIIGAMRRKPEGLAENDHDDLVNHCKESLRPSVLEIY